jgi:hypothetical protein
MARPPLTGVTCQSGRVGSVCYRLVVEGELGPRYSAAFEGMSIQRGEGTTAIVGMVRDQSDLHGLFERVAGLGLKIVSVTPEDGIGAPGTDRPGKMKPARDDAAKTMS